MSVSVAVGVLLLMIASVMMRGVVWARRVRLLAEGVRSPRMLEEECARLWNYIGRSWTISRVFLRSLPESLQDLLHSGAASASSAELEELRLRITRWQLAMRSLSGLFAVMLLGMAALSAALGTGPGAVGGVSLVAWLVSLVCVEHLGAFAYALALLRAVEADRNGED